MSRPMPKGFLPSIEFLRGIAALAVVLLHFSGFFYLPDWVHSILTYGGQGVVVFFVISGFVLPYSLASKAYKLPSFFRFLARRLLRLEPAYLACIALILGLRWGAATFSPYSERMFSFDWMQVLAHVGYLTELLGQVWLNPVFWTLGVELQFYLLIGLIFPLLIHDKHWVRYLTLGCFLASSFLPLGRSVMSHSPIFTAGILTFLYYKQYMSGREFFPMLVLAMSIWLLSSGWYFVPIGSIVFSIAIILYTNIDTKLTSFMGRVSYSLYLLHTVVGSSLVIDFALNYFEVGYWFNFIVIAAILFSYFAAWCFYRLFERPFIVLARKIKLG